MNTPNRIEQYEKKIAGLRQELLRLGPMHPGSLSPQYHVCGTPSCRCHHPTAPQKHGPYLKLTYVHRGKPVCRFVRAIHVQELQARLAAYKTFRALMDHWIALSIERGKADFFPASAKPRRKSPAKPR